MSKPGRHTKRRSSIYSDVSFQDTYSAIAGTSPDGSSSHNTRAPIPHNLVIRFPRELLDARVTYITAIASPTLQTTPNSILYWRLMCVFDSRVGGAVTLEFTSIRGRGIVALRHKSSMFPNDVLSSFPAIVIPPGEMKLGSPGSQRLLSGIIDIMTANRLTAYLCADDASDYIWWCSLVFKSLEGKYVQEGTNLQFMEFVANERRHRPEVRLRIPSVLKSGTPIPEQAQSNDDAHSGRTIRR